MAVGSKTARGLCAFWVMGLAAGFALGCEYKVPFIPIVDLSREAAFAGGEVPLPVQTRVDADGCRWFSSPDDLPAAEDDTVMNAAGETVSLPITEEGRYWVTPAPTPDNPAPQPEAIGYDAQPPTLNFVNSPDSYDLFTRNPYPDHIPLNAVGDSLSGFGGYFEADWKEGAVPTAPGTYYREYRVYDFAGNASAVFSHPVEVFNSNGRPPLSVSVGYSAAPAFRRGSEVWFENGPITATLSVSGGSGATAYSWKRDGVPFSPSTPNQCVTEAIADNTEAAVLYACLVTDSGGQKCSVRFTVGLDRKKPRITAAAETVVGLSLRERTFYREKRSDLTVEEAGSGIDRIDGEFVSPPAQAEYNRPYQRKVTVTDALGHQSDPFSYTVTFKGNYRADDESRLTGSDAAPPSTEGFGLPSDAQVAFMKMGQYAFIHFGPNTFSNAEWGNGYPKEAASFQPSRTAAVFTREWIEQASQMGMKGIILTVKHHDGFCLWDTVTTRHSVCKTGSNYNYFNEDVLKALIINMKEWNSQHPAAALKLGLYLSPWDRNNWTYLGADESYPVDDVRRYPYLDRVFRTQLTEIIGYVERFGEGKVILFELWLDGAATASGWYGGETYDRQKTNYSVAVEIDPQTHRSKPETFHDTFMDSAHYEGVVAAPHEALHDRSRPENWRTHIYCLAADVLSSYTPNKVLIFGYAEEFAKQQGQFGRGVRWIGNEQGWAGMTHWSTGSNFSETLHINTGSEASTYFFPGESDMKTQNGWFFTPNENKGEAKMIEYWYRTAGRNANLLLNFSPDKTGKIPDNTFQSAKKMNETVTNDLKDNLMRQVSRVVASDVRNDHLAFSPYCAADGDTETYWSVDDASGGETAWLEAVFETPVCFDRVVLQEAIRLGQRVKAFTVESKNGSEAPWQPVSFAPFPNSIDGADTSTEDRCETIGYKRILRTVPTTATHVRVSFTRYRMDTVVPVALSEFALFKAPN